MFAEDGTLSNIQEQEKASHKHAPHHAHTLEPQEFSTSPRPEKLQIDIDSRSRDINFPKKLSIERAKNNKKRKY